jgi:hypothetical protein
MAESSQTEAAQTGPVLLLWQHVRQLKSGELNDLTARFPGASIIATRPGSSERHAVMCARRNPVAVLLPGPGRVGINPDAVTLRSVPHLQFLYEPSGSGRTLYRVLSLTAQRARL